MFVRILFALFVLFAPAQARAAEALALKVFGFSPDGRYFGFMQYGGVGDGGEYIAELFVIDVARDRLVPGMPLRLASAQEKAPVEDDRPYGEWLGALAEKRFARTIDLYDFQPPGHAFAADEGARARDTFAISSDVQFSLGLKAMVFEQARLGRASVHLEEKRIPWPRNLRAGPGAEAVSCAEEVDWEPGAAFRLTLRRAGRTIVLNDDRTIPASRGCVLGYGIVEAHTFSRRDGQIALAVVLGMAARGFEGNDRLFLAVTALVKP